MIHKHKQYKYNRCLMSAQISIETIESFSPKFTPYQDPNLLRDHAILSHVTYMK